MGPGCWVGHGPGRGGTLPKNLLPRGTGPARGCGHTSDDGAHGRTVRLRARHPDPDSSNAADGRGAPIPNPGAAARFVSLQTLCGLSADSLRTLRRVHLYQLRYNQGIRRLGSAGRFGNADCSLCARCELRSIPPDRALTAKSSGRSVPFSPSARTLRSMWPRS